MQRFTKGDFAFTCNTPSQSPNDGRLVNIVDVLGPMPAYGIAFGYLVERVDGKPFEIAAAPRSLLPGQGPTRVFADEAHLRPLGRRRPRRSKRARNPFAPQRDLVNWLAS